MTVENITPDAGARAAAASFQFRLRRTLCAVLALGCALVVEPALAQEGVTSFPASYFAANQPATAYEMVGLLPGFQRQNGDTTVRGFSGTVGNVLIDGQLPTSKEETLDDLLHRITASSVERIELIRGAADMHGYTVLANVVRTRGATLRGRAELEGAVTHFGTTEDKIALHLTRQGSDSLLEASGTWSRQVGAQNQNGFGTRLRYLPNGTPLQLSNYDFPKIPESRDFSSSYRQPLLGGNLALGMALKQDRNYSKVTEHIYFPSTSIQTGVESTLSQNAEARLDYRRPLDGWGQAQLFAVHRITHQDELSQTVSSTATNISRGLFNQREDVARLAWYSPWTLKLEAGAEGAINVLSSHSTLSLAGAPVILPAANIRLEEKRMELFSNATWRFDPSLMTELGARYEFSNLTQTGDSNLVKDLSFFKPRWLTTWNFAPNQELRLLMERQVGQLVFRDFASSTSLNSNLVTGGNKNLEPARVWSVSLDWEYHFWDHGSLVLEAKREFISNVVDKVPVFSGTQVFNATGNIGYGVRDGFQVNLITPLDKLGLKGLTVTSEADTHHSKVRDPATGTYRQVVGGQVGATEFVFNSNSEVTYDMPELNLRLGANLHAHANSHESDYRIDEIDPSHHGFKLGIFAEYKPVPDWVVRIFGNDIAQTTAYRDRYVYAGLRGAAPLSYIEYRKLSNGTVWGLDIQHDF